jgi:hypothetical protein
MQESIQRVVNDKQSKRQVTTTPSKSARASSTCLSYGGTTRPAFKTLQGVPRRIRAARETVSRGTASWHVALLPTC